MNILHFFRRKGSAPMARERLQILLSHERVAGSHQRRAPGASRSAARAAAQMITPSRRTGVRRTAA